MAANAVVTNQKRPAWGKELDEREFAFVCAYLVDFNATKAGLAAGMPKAGAHVQAHLLKQRPHVREAIEAGLRERMPALKLTLAERLTAIAEADSADFVQIVEKRTVSRDPKTGARQTHRHLVTALTPTAKLSERQRAAVKGVKQRVGLYGTTIEVLLHDPIAAADRLATLLNLQPREQVAAVGAVTFIIEAPDGTAMKTIGPAPAPQIDRDAIDAQIAADAEPVEDLPPGAKPRSGLVIETP